MGVPYFFLTIGPPLKPWFSKVFFLFFFLALKRAFVLRVRVWVRQYVASLNLEMICDYSLLALLTILSSNLNSRDQIALRRSLTFSPPLPFPFFPSFCAHPYCRSINALPVKRLARSTTHWLSVHRACREHPFPFLGPM